MLHAGLKLGDRYRLDARIGAGGMGEVWRAVDEVLGRVVAVKAMLPGVADQPDFAKRFLIEAKSMASVNHPAVASIHDYGRGAGITFLVMEFVDGESLSQVLTRHGRLDPVTTMRLVAQAADGLQAVHDRGIVHRDIKPANLLIRRDGTLLVTDFGISRTHDATQLTASGAILGTPTYLSPEQVLGRPATGLSDVYSLGLAAYECLAGRRPFEGDNPYAVALQRVQAAPRTLGGDIPGPVLAVVDRALATDPADRWPSAAAMAAAARAAVAAPQARPQHWRPDPPPPPHPQSWQTDPTPPPEPRTGLSPAPPALPAPAPWAQAQPTPTPAPSAPGSGPRDPARRTIRRRLVVLAAVLLVVVAGGVTTWQAFGSGGEPGSGSSSKPASGAGPAAAAGAPAGFVTCGSMLCPAEPLCWAGITVSSGRAETPRDLDCTTEHNWETFAAVSLPPDVAGNDEGELILRKDLKAVCSAKVMAGRSRDREETDGWRREAWPVVLPGTDLRLVHCLAGPEGQKAEGSAFS